LLARVRPGGWAGADAELDAGFAALAAADVPSEEELAGLVPDLDAGPPDGEFAWLADLPGPLLDEYLAATTEPAVPEALAAGFWDRSTGDGCGFAAGGVTDALPPGAVLAGLAADVVTAGLERLSDDELIGVLRAGRRLASWSASVELAAAGDLMRRRMEQQAAGQARMADHADAEIAAALTLTGRAAGRLLDLAMALERLPLTWRALAAGVIDMPRAMAIAEEVTGLSEEHAAAVEERVLARAAGQTATQVRAAARRAVLAADPSAARKRREEAAREARVEAWAEPAGTAALAGRDLPPAGVLAADQHVSQLAAGLRAAGVAGTMDQLRALVFVALLTGQPVSTLVLPAATPTTGTARPSGGRSPGPPGTGSAPGAPGSPDASDSPGGPAVAGMVNLTMPLSTWLGLSASPGEVAGFGPLDAGDSRSLGQVMAAHPQTRWCLTIIDENGRAVAHGCARRRRGNRKRGSPGGGPGPPAGRSSPPAGGTRRDDGAASDRRAPPDDSAGRDGACLSAGSAAREEGAAPLAAPGPVTAARAVTGAPAAAADAGPPVDAGPAAVGVWVAGVEVAWLEAGECGHGRRVAGYRPSAVLEHLIRVRQQVCAFPGCQRAARRCDQDHTIPYDQGGRTCECNLAPLCRRHHQAKQAPGWHLDQPEPGTMIWATPSGRTYTTHPTVYPS
jgi:hypothetical protein